MTNRKWTCIGLAVAGLILIAGCANRDDHSDHSHHNHSHAHPSDAAEPHVSTAEEIAQAKPYPLDVCIVSDEKLGSMGEPVVQVHDGQVVKFCCRGCVSEFEENPDKFTAKLNP
jgi:hypothetical protein